MKSHRVLILFAVGVVLSLSAERSLAEDINAGLFAGSGSAFNACEAIRNAYPGGGSPLNASGGPFYSGVCTSRPRNWQAQFPFGGPQQGNVFYCYYCPANPPRCPDGFTTEKDTGRCIRKCKEGTIDNGFGRCVPYGPGLCPDGFRWEDGADVCVQSSCPSQQLNICRSAYKARNTERMEEFRDHTSLQHQSSAGTRGGDNGFAFAWDWASKWSDRQSFRECLQNNQCQIRIPQGIFN